jgi:hypothetical protein
MITYVGFFHACLRMRQNPLLALVSLSVLANVPMTTRADMNYHCLIRK